MTRKVLIIDAHPDADEARFCHAMARAYDEGAAAAGAEIRRIRLCEHDIALLRSMGEFNAPPSDPFILAARADIEWADHLVFLFPLWLGSGPVKLRAFFEQIARGGFVAEIDARGWRPRLKGKSARLIVTMGMPAPAYQLMFGGHGVSSIRKSILGFAGVGPVRTTLLGMIETGGRIAGEKRLARIAALGRRCA